MRVLTISGSLRQHSHNTSLLRAAAILAPSGVELVAWERLGELPHYSEDIDVSGEGVDPVVADLRDAIGGADALLIATPEYNSSIPGSLKNALDWASRPYGESALTGKPVAVVGASAGLFGAVWAQAEVRKVLAASGSQVLDRELPVGSAYEAFAEDGSLIDEETDRKLASILGELLTSAVGGEQDAASENELAVA